LERQRNGALQTRDRGKRCLWNDPGSAEHRYRAAPHPENNEGGGSKFPVSHRLQTDNVAILDAQPFERVRVCFTDDGKLGQLYIRPFVPQRSQRVFLVAYGDEKVFFEGWSTAAHARSGRSDFPDFAHATHYDPRDPSRKRYSGCWAGLPPIMRLLWLSQLIERKNDCVFGAILLGQH
jgi:hypothetical protein